MKLHHCVPDIISMKIDYTFQGSVLLAMKLELVKKIRDESSKHHRRAR